MFHPVCWQFPSFEFFFYKFRDKAPLISIILAPNSWKTPDIHFLTTGKGITFSAWRSASEVILWWTLEVARFFRLTAYFPY